MIVRSAAKEPTRSDNLVQSCQALSISSSQIVAPSKYVESSWVKSLGKTVSNWIKQSKSTIDLAPQPSKKNDEKHAQTLTHEALVLCLGNSLRVAFCSTPCLAIDKAHPSLFMFQCLVEPTMNIVDFVKRLAKYTGISGEAMIMATIHVARIVETYPTFYVNALTIHRLILATMLVSAKFFDDSYINNKDWATVGGVSVSAINTLEVEILYLLNFNLLVQENDYAMIYKEITS